MACPYGFLKLPRELRDEIYGYYFTLEGGYSYNHNSQKLRRIDGQPIDLSLSRVCRMIATETRGFALGSNTISFSTMYKPELSETLGRFDVYRHLLFNLMDNFLADHAPRFSNIDRATQDFISRHQTQIVPSLAAAETQKDIIYCDIRSVKEVPSRIRHFIASTFDSVSVQPDKMKSDTDYWTNKRIDQCASINTTYNAWTIPTDNDVDKLRSIVGSRSIDSYIWAPNQYWNEMKYRLSAAAVAIHFLTGLPIKVRNWMRTILLNEDHLAIGWPECHAQGLITFCQENPQLRIERKVCLWRNAFYGGPLCHYSIINEESRQLFNQRIDWLDANEVSGYCIAPWVMEALHLSSLGMPRESFKLILDGEPLLEKTSQIFDVVQQDAAWQSAYERHCRNTGFSSHSQLRDVRMNAYNIMNGFPKAIHDITNGNSIVQCNFDVGQAYDVERIVEDTKEWSLQEWQSGWAERRPQMYFETDPPLPSWLELRREDLV